jgi:hypothetical protein
VIPSPVLQFLRDLLVCLVFERDSFSWRINRVHGHPVEIVFWM